MFTHIGSLVGLLICLYYVLFRWQSVVARYGRLSLYWWVLAIGVFSSFIGFLVDAVLLAIYYAM